MKVYSKALQGPPDPTPVAEGVVRGIIWWYCNGEGDDPDFILFRDKGCPVRIDIPEEAGWPRNRQQALDLGLKVLQHGYFRPRPFLGVTLTPRHDRRALSIPNLV
jgi:hypothetical protein